MPGKLHVSLKMLFSVAGFACRSLVQDRGEGGGSLLDCSSHWPVIITPCRDLSNDYLI